MDVENTPIEIKVKQLEFENEELKAKVEILNKFKQYAYKANKFIQFLHKVTGHEGNKKNCKKLNDIFQECYEAKEMYNNREEI